MGERTHAISLEVNVCIFAPPFNRPFYFASFLLLFFFVPRAAVPASPTHSQDPASSTASLQVRADSGDPVAQFKLAYSLLFDTRTEYSVPDYAAGVRWLRSSASQHFAPAQFFLGYLYEHGQGVPVDYALAAENYRAAALQGNAAAENNLCVLYYYGRGVPKDLHLAFESCRASALHGSPVGQYHLASFYFLGDGIAPDLTQAISWFRAAAAQGFAQAQANLAVIYSEGAGVPRDDVEAARWARLAAEQGLSQAASRYAYLCENGRGVSRDYFAAYTWYSRAIAAGDKTVGARLKAVSHHLSRSQRKQANSILAAEVAPPQRAPAGAEADVSLIAYH